ncbi:hypothetical protein CLF_103608 [Clonorchis sinensis]|uniref:Uncharacterized protein n=1 Tax=Clonorchis sinensis TaxID=79923 RepID=G7YA10_CLOSI|nr:hypothetical protein CLF_103608 [Clonorchis sinensis]
MSRTGSQCDGSCTTIEVPGGITDILCRSCLQKFVRCTCIGLFIVASKLFTGIVPYRLLSARGMPNREKQVGLCPDRGCIDYYLTTLINHKHLLTQPVVLLRSDVSQGCCEMFCDTFLVLVAQSQWVCESLRKILIPVCLQKWCPPGPPFVFVLFQTRNRIDHQRSVCFLSRSGVKLSPRKTLKA